MKTSIFSLCTFALIVEFTSINALAKKMYTQSEQSDYKENWSSLRKHNTPSWLEDAKFGIYFHWGANSVKNEQRDQSLSTMQAIEQWKGDKFDAKVWVDLMQNAGAQFGGPVAWHCNGIVNWDSAVTDWNSVNKGPKVDIFGQLTKELRKRDMKVLSSYHTCLLSDTIWGAISKENRTYLSPEKDYSALETLNEGRVADILYDAWYARITEAMGKYQPDIVWLDTGFGGTVIAQKNGDYVDGRLIPSGDNSLRGVRQHYQQKLIAHYFNEAQKWGEEVEVIYKTHDIPPGIGMRDIEDGNLKGLQYDAWIADIDMAYHVEYGGHWFYNKNNPMKDAGTLIDLLVDITSKNGRMLLNVPPKADGSFAKSQIEELGKMGEWLKLNGEAIYGTMPWVYYGEGPTEIKHTGHHAHNFKEIPIYTNEDIRFTTKDNILYAISLDWAGDTQVIRTLGTKGKLYPGDIKKITLLGSEQTLSWKQNPEALVIDLPKNKSGNYAYVFKIQLN